PLLPEPHTERSKYRVRPQTQPAFWTQVVRAGGCTLIHESSGWMIASVSGNDHGGWRFNFAYNTNGFDWGHLSPSSAAALPDSQLRTNAFFDFGSIPG